MGFLWFFVVVGVGVLFGWIGFFLLINNLGLEFGLS